MRILLNPKQNEYIRNANCRWNLKIGAVRSGKSFVDISYVIPSRLRAVKDLPGLNVILGVSKETIESNVLQPMRELYTDAVVSNINSRNIAYICGVPVYCLGAEKSSQVSKIRGKSIKYCYGDEIAEWCPEVFTMLESRLDKPYSRFDGACNPEYPSHWLKQFIDKPGLDAYIQKYTIFDNPALSAQFVDNLCKEYEGTVFYDRYILGEWVLAEGLIYPMYRDALEKPPATKASRYALSIDYGTRNAFAALLWGRYGDVWYAVDGYYYSGRDTGVNKTDEEYAIDLERWLSAYIPEGCENNPWRYKFLDDSSKRLLTIVDPSAASFITLLERKRQYRLIDADNAVLDGIRETATAMHKGLIKVNPAIDEWVTEASGYVWDDDAGEDRPVKEADHYMDSMRYLVKTLEIALPKKQYEYGWNV